MPTEPEKTEPTTPAKTEGTPETPPGTPPAQAKPNESVTPPETPAAKKEPTRATLAAEDDDLPNVDILEMPKKALEKRLKSASKAELNRLYEKYEVKDAEELAALVKEARDGRATKEEQRIAQLSKEEKLEEERQRTAAERDEWKGKYERSIQMAEIREQSSAMTKIAGEHINPKYVKYHLGELAAFLTKTYSDEELKDLPDEVVHEYWKKFATDNPELAAKKTQAPPEKTGLTNGAPDKNPPPAKAEEGKKGYGVKKDASGRTIETPEEARAAREEMRRAGLVY